MMAIVNGLKKKCKGELKMNEIIGYAFIIIGVVIVVVKLAKAINEHDYK